MLTLPQHSKDEKRQEELNESAKEREALVRPGWPTQHKVVPGEEQSLYIKTSRSLQIDYFRLWINWAGTSLRNWFRPSSSLLDRHLTAMWLFPKPQCDASLQFPIPDGLFAQQRFCGPQTSFLTRVIQMPPWVPDNPDLLKKMEDGRLFSVNYSIFAEYQLKQGVSLPKIVGIFSVSVNGDSHKAECFYVEDTLVTKDSPGMWEYAKLCFQLNDIVGFYVINRTCGSFLFLEPIVLHFYACISKKHPLYALFNPVFFGHANACRWVRKLVLKEKGAIGCLLPLTSAGTRDIVKAAYAGWSFDSTSPTFKLSQRHLTDARGFAYAEDTLEIYQVVQQTMISFVDKFYNADEDIANDGELQNWVSQVADPEKGKVRGFPSRINDRDDLIDVLSRIFHQFVFERCMINFSQYDHMTFMPTFPTFLSKWSSKPLTSEDVIRLLSGEQRTSWQLHGVFAFCYEIVEPPVWESKTLQMNMLEILESMQKRFQETKTVLRNKVNVRPTPYKYFILHTSFLK